MGCSFVKVFVEKKKTVFVFNYPVFTYWEVVWDETIVHWFPSKMYKIKQGEINEHYDATYNKYLDWLSDEPIVSSCHIVDETKFLN